MDDWGTHIHALAAAVQNTQGAVLELGCGEYSTPLLHALCSGRGRLVVSLERDPEWKARFDKYAAVAAHEVVLVPNGNWGAALSVIAPRPAEAAKWGVVFVDHAPGERRATDIALLRPHADIIVAHDTEASVYGWGDVWSGFGWCWTYQRYGTWTTLAGPGELPEWVEPALVFGSAGPPIPYR